MTDISKTIEAKSDQLNADDLLAGPRTITVTKVDVGNQGDDQPVKIFYDGDNGKPYKPNKSMRRVIARVWGKESSQYVGRSMTLFCNPTVKWAGMEVGGIQISHMTNLDSKLEMALTVTRGKKKPYVVKPLEGQPQTQQTEQADYSAQLEACKAAARNGTSDLKAEWEAMSPDARKALAGELSGLKQLAASQSSPNDQFETEPEHSEPATGDYDGV